MIGEGTLLPENLKQRQKHRFVKNKKKKKSKLKTLAGYLLGTKKYTQVVSDRALYQDNHLKAPGYLNLNLKAAFLQGFMLA